jgi:hypothetical protein
MMTNDKNPASIPEATPEEETVLERSSAPTVLDLRAAAKDLFKTTEAEPDSTSPNNRLPQEEA